MEKKKQKRNASIDCDAENRKNMRKSLEMLLPTIFSSTLVHFLKQFYPSIFLVKGPLQFPVHENPPNSSE